MNKRKRKKKERKKKGTSWSTKKNLRYCRQKRLACQLCFPKGGESEKKIHKNNKNIIENLHLIPMKKLFRQLFWL